MFPCDSATTTSKREDRGPDGRRGDRRSADGEQARLVAARPDVAFVPPYVGHKGWIGLHLDGARVDWGELADLVEASYGLIAPRRLAAEVDDPGRGRRRRR